jgi:hypothetical protein
MVLAFSEVVSEWEEWVYFIKTVRLEVPRLMAPLRNFKRSDPLISNSALGSSHQRLRD